MKPRQLFAMFCLSFTLNAVAQEGDAGPSLYERLGGEEGITNILKKTMELHLANAQLAPYFKHLDQDWFLKSALSFFSAGTGGPHTYSGVDPASAHTHLKISNEIFDMAMGDIYASMEASGVDQVSRDEVAATLESFRAVVVNE